MTPNEKAKFIRILGMEQEELHYYLLGKLESAYGIKNIFTDDANYIFAKGQNTDVLMVAHIDTVHPKAPKPEEIFHDQQKNTMWSPVGIGGDDRCGVFTVLALLDRGYRPSVFFGWNEEIGCVGSAYFSTYLEDLVPTQIADYILNDIPFAIQIDRRGFGESVYYDLDSQDFENYINSFGFETKIGSYSDISEICPEFGFAGVNLSAGYINEHHLNETIYVSEMFNTINKVDEILKDNPKGNANEFIYVSNYSGYGYENGGYYFQDPLSQFTDDDETKFYGSPTEDDDYDDDDAYFEQLRRARLRKDDQVCQMCQAPRSSGILWTDDERPIYHDMCDMCRDYYDKTLEERNPAY